MYVIQNCLVLYIHQLCKIMVADSRPFFQSHTKTLTWNSNSPFQQINTNQWPTQTKNSSSVLGTSFPQTVKTKTIMHTIFPQNEYLLIFQIKWSLKTISKRHRWMLQWYCCAYLFMNSLKTIQRNCTLQTLKLSTNWGSHSCGSHIQAVFSVFFCFILFFFTTIRPFLKMLSCVYVQSLSKLHLILENSALNIDCNFLLLQSDSYNLISYSVFRNFSCVSSLIFM